jgi:antitoxin StbD
VIFRYLFRYLLGMAEVLPTNEARAKLNQIAAGFDHDGPDAVPVVFGSHRRAQGVIVSWQLWQRIAPAVEDLLDADLARRRIKHSPALERCHCAQHPGTGP